MDKEAKGKSVRVPEENILRHVEEAYHRGQTVEAFRRAETFAPLRDWRGARPCVLAARIASHVGAPRLATRLAVRARRSIPQNPEALAQFGYEMLRLRGPLAAWQTLRSWQEGPDPAAERAEVLVVQSRAAADLRDFACAEKLLKRADAIDPNRPWIRLQFAHLLERQDRVEEALAIAQEVLAAHPQPFYRPAVQIHAHLLQLLDRDEQAIQVLQEADQALQSASVAAQLFGLLSENGRWTEAGQALERSVELSPLLELPGRKWVDSQRARVAYHRGQREEAARLAGGLKDEFHRRFAANLVKPPTDTDRVEWDVTFVRQHFKTCAPATLAALGRFWRMPAEHLKLAEAICYDGTPHWQQRDWAEHNGWHVREFRVTQESATALIERGLPFAISVVETLSAHMMGVMGLDRVRATLLLRDPGQPYVVETPMEEFLQRYRAFGPHGMLFVPQAEGGRLAGIDLPDAALYDGLHRLRLALSRHDRAGAVQALTQMEAADPAARLTWDGRLDIAAYDGSVVEQARCLDQMIESHPDDATLRLRRFSVVQDGSREERLKYLEPICSRQGADPALTVALARVMQGDARRGKEARRLLRQAMRLRPLDTMAISTLADSLWNEGRLDEAVECYRFAANLEMFREHLYQAWFVACRRTRRTEEALAHLQDRFERFGARSEQPALTLAWACWEIEQPARARRVLEEAIRLRPEDGSLLLRAAGLLSSLGANAEAERFHDAARGRVRENDWLRTRLEIAQNRLEFEAVVKVAREILEREPLALDAHASLAVAVARREGTLAALEELKKACAGFPHHYGLQRMLVEWSCEAGADLGEEAARTLLRLEPSDAWGRRELALCLLRQNRASEALPEAEEAARIEPGNSYSFSVLGLVQSHLGQIPEARAQFRHAVALSVDNGAAISSLLEMTRTDAERREDLALVESELIRQVVTGDGLLAYLDYARPILSAESLLKVLRQAHAERPDLWHAWAALVSQLAHLEQLDEALTLALQAAERFPHLPRVWLELATLYHWRNQSEEEIGAAERAFEINPAWNRCCIALTDALERREQFDQARQIYERALKHAPQDAMLHARHASLLWRQQQHDSALAAVERALRLAPGYDFAWGLLSDCSTQVGQTGRTAEFARRLTRERAGDSRVWLILARILDPSATCERLAAVDRAIQLDPRHSDAYDLKAELLAEAERFDDAIQACNEGLSRCHVETHILRGRCAWIEMRRRRLPEAVALMRSVLEENQSYVWGWHQLALWLLEQESIEDATGALEHLRRLRPHDGWVNRQLGFVRLRRQDFDGARKAFAEALETHPTDVAAAHNLLELQLRDSDWPAAEKTLQRMQRHQPGAATVAASILLAVNRKPNVVPRAEFEALCALPDPDPWPLNAAVNALQQAGQGGEVRSMLKRAIKAGCPNPQLRLALVRLLTEQKSLWAATRACLRLPSVDAQAQAVVPLIQALTRHRRSWLTRRVLRRCSEALVRDDEAWGYAGFAMTHFGWKKRALQWMRDWRQRAQVQPWMLFNYCLALRETGDVEEATAVAHHVVKNWGHRHGSEDLRLFLAIEDALSGKVTAAEEHLGRLVAREAVIYEQQLMALARALVDVQSAPRTERARRFRAARDTLGPCFGAWQTLNGGRDVRRTLRRAAKRLRVEGAGISCWLWFQWKLHWQWSLLPFAPLALFVAGQPAFLLGLLVWSLVRRRLGDR